MESKILLSFCGIFFTGLVMVVEIDQPCSVDGQVILSPEVVIEHEASGYKHCFEFESDYQIFYKGELQELKDNEPSKDAQDFGAFNTFEDLHAFAATLNEEAERGNITVDDMASNEDLETKIAQLQDDKNITYFRK